MAPQWFHKILSRMRNSVSRPAVSLSADVERAHASRRLGQLGESAAVKLLSKQGYRIIERNYLCRSGEIDIIAEHQGHIVFIEVKTRSPRAWTTPESAITLEKQTRIRRAATYYLAGYKRSSPVRYDTVSVMTDDQNCVTSVKLKQNAFGNPERMSVGYES